MNPVCVHRIPAWISTSKRRSSATRSSRRDTNAPAAHLHGPGGSQSSQHVSQRAFIPLPCYTLGFFLRARGGGDEEIHLLTDSAILDFCYSPSVTWSAPTFTRGGLSPGENVIIRRTAWYMRVYMWRFVWKAVIMAVIRKEKVSGRVLYYVQRLKKVLSRK